MITRSATPKLIFPEVYAWKIFMAIVTLFNNAIDVFYIFIYLLTLFSVDYKILAAYALIKVYNPPPPPPSPLPH